MQGGSTSHPPMDCQSAAGAGKAVARVGRGEMGQGGGLTGQAIVHTGSHPPIQQHAHLLSLLGLASGILLAQVQGDPLLFMRYKGFKPLL